MQQSHRESKTSLYQEPLFIELLDREIARSRRYARPLSLIMGWCTQGSPFSKDHLDTWSRLARDVDFGATLGEAPRLVMVLPETDRAGASVVAERFRRAFGSEPSESSDPEAPALAVVSYPYHGSTSEALLRSAEDLAGRPGDQISVGSFRKIVEGDRL